VLRITSEAVIEGFEVLATPRERAAIKYVRQTNNVY